MFTSFDNDADLRGNLVAQSKHRDSPFSIVDCSLKASYDEKWRKKVRGIIGREPTMTPPKDCRPRAMFGRGPGPCHPPLPPHHP